LALQNSLLVVCLFVGQKHYKKKDKVMKKLLAVSFFFITLMSVLISANQVCAQERFIDNGDGTVTDTLLNIMWAASDNQGDINWREAQQWVKYTFPYTIKNSYDNWRLPTIDELKTLFDGDNEYESECGQNLKIVPAIELTCGWVWASEMKFISAKLFNFHRGYSYTDRIGKYKKYRALPVRDLE
jgi:hypothetical protein